MNIDELPEKVRLQYAEEKETHDTYCNEGYIEHIDIFKRGIKEVRCRYCERFNKEIFKDD
jgi:hypothetical protein